MDGGCYAIDCLRLLGGDVPSVTGALADPCPPFPGRGPAAVADRSMAARLTWSCWWPGPNVSPSVIDSVGLAGAEFVRIADSARFR